MVGWIHFKSFCHVLKRIRCVVGSHSTCHAAADLAACTWQDEWQLLQLLPPRLHFWHLSHDLAKERGRIKVTNEAGLWEKVSILDLLLVNDALQVATRQWTDSVETNNDWHHLVRDEWYSAFDLYSSGELRRKFSQGPWRIKLLGNLAQLYSSLCNILRSQGTCTYNHHLFWHWHRALAKLLSVTCNLGWGLLAFSSRFSPTTTPRRCFSRASHAHIRFAIQVLHVMYVYLNWVRVFRRDGQIY